MRMIAIALMTSLTGAAVMAVPQARTDFSGRWTTEAEATPAAAQPGGGAAPSAGRGRGPAQGSMGSGWGPTLTIAQDARQLTIEYTVFARGDMQPPLKFAYALDGSETKNTVMMGRGMETQASRAAWDGAKLKITSMHQMINPATGKPQGVQVVQTLSLESPSELVVETVRAGVLGAADTTTRTVYRKM